MTNNSTLHIDCPPASKAAWLRTARINGQPLAEWVQSTLNAATADTAPDWAAGLSERATIALLSAGFDSRESIEQALAENYNFVALPNFGRRCHQELLTWLQQ